jgi:hypothetical protein
VMIIHKSSIRSERSVALRFDSRRWSRDAQVLRNLAKQWMKLAIELAERGMAVGVCYTLTAAS